MKNGSFKALNVIKIFVNEKFAIYILMNEVFLSVYTRQYLEKRLCTMHL